MKSRKTTIKHHETTIFHIVMLVYQRVDPFIQHPYPSRLRHPGAAGLCWLWSRPSGLEGRLGLGESGGVAGAGAGPP